MDVLRRDPLGGRSLGPTSPSAGPSLPATMHTRGLAGHHPLLCASLGAQAVCSLQSKQEALIRTVEASALDPLRSTVASIHLLLISPRDQDGLSSFPDLLSKLCLRPRPSLSLSPEAVGTLGRSPSCSLSHSIMGDICWIFSVQTFSLSFSSEPRASRLSQPLASLVPFHFWADWPFLPSTLHIV